MQPKTSDWTWHCGNCGHWVANLQTDFAPGKGLPHSESDDPIGFLEPVRLANFRHILARIEALGVPRHRDSRILDIGCASGFFLKTATDHGYAALGIEPKLEMAEAARRHGAEVRHGFFPDVLQADEKFHVIIFNDVLEHIPDIGAILDACRAHLHAYGLLVVNIPNAQGLFYRLATLMHGLGMTGPFHRLWQTMFYTPHLHYVTPQSLTLLAERHGFARSGEIERLVSVSYSGLRERVAADPSLGVVGRIVMFVGTAVLVPLTRIFPSDIIVGFFRAR